MFPREEEAGEIWDLGHPLHRAGRPRHLRPHRLLVFHRCRHRHIATVKVSSDRVEARRGRCGRAMETRQDVHTGEAAQAVEEPDEGVPTAAAELEEARSMVDVVVVQPGGWQDRQSAAAVAVGIGLGAGRRDSAGSGRRANIARLRSG